MVTTGRLSAEWNQFRLSPKAHGEPAVSPGRGNALAVASRRSPFELRAAL